jgi:hypothetical protein
MFYFLETLVWDFLVETSSNLNFDLLGPKPGPPRNLTVTEIPNGFLISWQVPLERAHLVQFYTIKYRTDAQWKVRFGSYKVNLAFNAILSFADSQSWSNSTRGNTIFSEKFSRRSYILFSRLSQFFEKLWIEWRSQISSSSASQGEL